MRGKQLLTGDMAGAAEVSDVTRSNDRLVVFDFDGTLTVDKDRPDRGLTGQRLERLLEMSARLRASGTHCLIVTAQFPSATLEVTIPLLRQSGLAALFGEACEDGVSLCTFTDAPCQGRIYNGLEAMTGKIALLRQIIAGRNCWRLAFAPERVLFLDDSAANFAGHAELGICVRHVQQDGMNEADIEFVEAFAEGRSDGRGSEP